MIRIAAVLIFLGGAAAACGDGAVLVQGEFGQARFAVELADDPAERAQGLMFRESLPTMAGMLFVYERPGPASFWMRNTLIPLDMLFIDETGTVRYVHPEAQPLDETPIFGGNDILAVLEINGGLAARLGIEEGDVVAHPAFDPEIAALPCE